MMAHPNWWKVRRRMDQAVAGMKDSHGLHPGVRALSQSSTAGPCGRCLPGSEFPSVPGLGPDASGIRSVPEARSPPSVPPSAGRLAEPGRSIRVGV